MKLLQSLTFTAGVALSLAGTANAAAPSAYYAGCENRGGQSLLQALNETISNHTVVSYSGLWTLYYTSDVDEDGKIWDMYSTKRWRPGSEQCGNYSSIGDCYNREHSMPKSWFNDASPMVSDAFHIYPTDGKVNGQRSNYPFGECANGSYVASSGGVKALGRLGASTFEGYSGTVFEPDDQYKGDFARSYFYMAACYYDRIGTWKSDMLAGNSFPAFSSWALKLLLKWHRQDPVSKKETDRNDAVYASQHNRNPFIDHPEMVEYIWGDKSGERWSQGGSITATINQPVDGSTTDLGVTASGHALTKAIAVQTSGATTNVAVSVTGTGFSVSPASISAATANGGTTVTVTYLPQSKGTHTATMKVTAGSAVSTITLRGRAIDGLPIGDAIEITDRSFVAVWTYVGDEDASGNYQLSVTDDAGMLPGYPRAVNAKAGKALVDNLMPATDYIFSLSSVNLVSGYGEVRTAQAWPAIDFLFDGTLRLVGTPGEPSEPAEILIATDNVDSDFNVSVKAPFELSADRSHWSEAITLSADESRMYIRVNSAKAGTFESPITATYGSYTTDDAVVTAIVANGSTFLEDFETVNEHAGSYTDKEYMGTACKWYIRDGGLWIDDEAHSGDYALRLGKSSTSSVEMAEDRLEGIGTASFYARTYGSDEAPTLIVEYSIDGGTSFVPVSSVKVGEGGVKEGNWSSYKVHVGAPSGARLRLRQTAGRRVLIDDIALTDNLTGVADATAERHRWDAFSHSGTLFVELSEAMTVSVYAVDGTCLVNGMLEAGTHSFDGLQAGAVYIVASGDFSRTILIR